MQSGTWEFHLRWWYKGEKAKIKGSFWFLQDMRLFFCYLLGESWQDVLDICRKFIPKVLGGIPQLQWVWHNCLSENLHSITCFGICIQKVFHHLLKTSLYFASLISRSRCFLFFFDKTIGRNPKHFHLLCLFFHDAFGGQSNDNNNVHTICIFFTVA